MTGLLARTGNSIAVLLIGIASIIVAGSPASAANGGQFPADSFTWTVIGSGGAPTTGTLTMDGTAPIFNTIVTLDTAPLAGIATVTAASALGCTTAGAIITCPEGSKDIGDADSDWQAQVGLTITPLAGATEGKVVKIPLTTAADGIGPNSSSLTITFTQHPILAPREVLLLPGVVHIGDQLPIEPVVQNVGSTTASSVVFTFEFSHALSPDSYDNCVYGPFTARDGEYVRCTVPGPVAPGAIVGLNGFKTTVPDDSPNFGDVRFIADPDAASPDDPFPPSSVHLVPRPASGTTVTLTTASGGPIANDPTDTKFPAVQANESILGVTYDLGAAAVNVSGSVGSTVTADVVVTNHGPNEAFGEGVGVRVHIPTWATATGVPATCGASSTDQGIDVLPSTKGPLSGYPYYYCVSDSQVVPVGTTATFAFHFKITSTSGSDGSITILNLPPQTNAADDTAMFKLSTATGPTPSPSSSSPSPTAGPSTTAPGSGSGTSLPKTGSDWGIIAASGMAIVLAGFGLLLLARRRRV